MLPFVGLALWLVWEMVSSCWALVPAHTWEKVGVHVNLLLVALPVLWGVNEHYRMTTVLRTLLLSGISSVIVYMMMQFWILNAEYAIDKWYFQTPMFTDWLKNGTLLMTIKHRLHFCSLLTMSVLSAFYLIPTWRKQYGMVLTGVFAVLSVLFLCFGIYSTGSRAVLLNLVALGAVTLALLCTGWKRYVAVLALPVVGLAAAWSMLHFHPRFEGQSMEEIFAIHEDEEMPSFEPRLAIWHEAFEQPSDYVLYGVGAGCVGDYLTPKYEAHGWTKYIEHRYHAHNQFLTECIELGIVPAIMFLLIWLIYPCTQPSKVRHLSLYLTIVLVMTMLTENVFNGVEGTINTCVALMMVALFATHGIEPYAHAQGETAGDAER